MKALLNKLKKVQEQIIKQVEIRDAKSLKKPDTWRDTPSGKKFEAKTASMADSVEGLAESIEHLETALKPHDND